MHSIWSGVISFALINIPVRLYSATVEHAIDFDMLHKSDLSPIRFARICLADGKEIPYKDIVKGYEYQKGEYVVIDEKDFKEANPKKTSEISILQFVDKEEIEAVFFDKPYFLEPGKGGNKAYALLRETLEKSKKVALVRYVFRSKEHIGILMPFEKTIVLNQMRFLSEIRNPKELELSDVEVSKKELEISLKLVDQLSEKFNPAQYHDEYTEELMELIKGKIKGKKPSKKKGVVPKPSSKIVDITSLLEQSLKESKPKKVKAKARKAG